MKILLFRHGTTQGNLEGRYLGSTDDPILPEEFEKLASIQKKCMPVDVVFISPLLRCRQTAGILYPKQPHFIVPELREMNFGEFENKNYMELSRNPDYQSWIDSGGTTAFPGGESRAEFQQRTIGAFRYCMTLCMQNDWKSAAVIAHGGTVMSLLDAYSIPHRDYFEWKVPNGTGYLLDTEPEAFLHGRMGLVVNENIR